MLECSASAVDPPGVPLCQTHYDAFAASPFFKRWSNGVDVVKRVAISSWWRLCEAERRVAVEAAKVARGAAAKSAEVPTDEEN
ncbi:MAG: hypothetical protein A2W26_03170 [Acidobacteria bacterium RBG_16_64_8]|nr:MAG: hypothetical protein A2W26_03170 [Acidobacteria bacterium RBG_16_64_8]